METDALYKDMINITGLRQMHGETIDIFNLDEIRGIQGEAVSPGIFSSQIYNTGDINAVIIDIHKKLREVKEYIGYKPSFDLLDRDIMKIPEEYNHSFDLLDRDIIKIREESIENCKVNKIIKISLTYDSHQFDKESTP